ncbi:MAG TPA: hypothetical protein VFV80_06390 [Geminicoccaceae bacterium]|nr:hypothetical protein [Geminicoccaceae bacterium]
MPRAKAAQRVAAANVTASLAALLSPARAEASRRNGARSRGPDTPEGKARASRNALKHGLRAEKFAVVAGENPQAFAAFEAALIDDLAPRGALQRLLAGRIARAAWRLERAERIEAELFAREMKGLFDDGDLGLALIRDGNGARAFDTLLRYRGAAQAEFTRALRTLKELRAEAAQAAELRPGRPEAPALPPANAGAAEAPNEPETRRNPRHATAAAMAEPEAGLAVRPDAGHGAEGAERAAPGEPPPARSGCPIEPEPRANPELPSAPADGSDASDRHGTAGAAAPSGPAAAPPPASAA